MSQANAWYRSEENSPEVTAVRNNLKFRMIINI